MSTPQANAELRAVYPGGARTGARDDWDAPTTDAAAGAGAAKWTGAAGVYWREEVDRVAGDGGVTVVTRFVLYLESRVARDAGIDTDDELELAGPDGVLRRARATAVAVRELAGVPSSLQTARLELELLR